MIAMSDTVRATLQRDITEALLRLRLARCQRATKDVEVFTKRLDWLLDRFAAHMRVEEDS